VGILTQTSIDQSTVVLTIHYFHDTLMETAIDYQGGERMESNETASDNKTSTMEVPSEALMNGARTADGNTYNKEPLERQWSGVT
jgi:hypothetical protein